MIIHTPSVQGTGRLEKNNRTFDMRFHKQGSQTSVCPSMAQGSVLNAVGGCPPLCVS